MSNSCVRACQRLRKSSRSKTRVFCHQSWDPSQCYKIPHGRANSRAKLDVLRISAAARHHYARSPTAVAIAVRRLCRLAGLRTQAHTGSCSITSSSASA